MDSQSENSKNEQCMQKYMTLQCEHDRTYAKKSDVKKCKFWIQAKFFFKKKKRIVPNIHKAKTKKSKNNGITQGSKTDFNKLKFYTLNVGGLKSKYLSEDLEEYWIWRIWKNMNKTDQITLISLFSLLLH